MAALITIALVDDDRVSSLYARKALLHHPRFLLVGIATSAREAAPMLRRARPRVALVDWLLGDGDGTAIIAALAPELPDTRWILASAWSAAELVVQAERVGAHGILDKAHLEEHYLAEAIEAVARGGEYYCPASQRLIDATRSALGGLLSPDRYSVLTLLASGYARAQIAAHLGISRPMVTKHIAAIARALKFAEAPDDAELIRAARRRRLLPRMPTRALFDVGASHTL